MSSLLFDYDLSKILNSKKYYFLVDDKLDLNIKNDQVINISVSEKIKSLEFYQEIIDQLLKDGVHKKSHLLVIGGGCLSDFGGYIAATLFRGISWSVIPTTLLAQVDAAIGGKTALNFKMIKNVIGAFHEPTEIFINSKWLETLPRDEIFSGKGEILKYCFLEKDIFLKVLNKKPMDQIIKSCALYKKDITSRDLRDNNFRMTLNLGHTIGHAIESVTAYPHGICIALGLQMIIKMYQPNLINKFDTLIEHLEIPLNTYKVPPAEKLKGFLTYDKKKIEDNKLQIILPNDVGVIEIKKVGLTDFFKKLDELK